MVAPVHLLYPGGEHERIWLEEVVHITKDGGGRCSPGASSRWSPDARRADRHA